MATGGSDSESTVRSALTDFLKAHNLHDNVSDIDEIVLSYVISILEDLGDSRNAEENIDVDQFVEMMEAYLPGFASIDSVTVCEWMFELASILSKPQEARNRIEEQEKEEEAASCTGNSSHIQKPSPAPIKHAAQLDSAGESERSSSESSTDELDEQVQVLTEMFPSTLQLEILHCLQGSEGDLDRAVQLILHREEAGLSITEEQKSKQRKGKTFNLLDDKQERQKIIARYGHIDVAADEKTYKPPMPKDGPKKMVRYLDNQIVNTKGQKFTDVKTRRDGRHEKDLHQPETSSQIQIPLTGMKFHE